MRTKTRTAKDLKPGMVIRSQGMDAYGTDMTPFRQVAKVEKLTAWAERFITFTDGTRVNVGDCREFEVARSKTTRNAAIRGTTATFDTRHPLDCALALFGAYAIA